MSNSAVELQQAARLGAGGLPLVVVKVPTGDYMFSGSVPVELVFERLDGKPLTAEQSRYLSNFYPNKIARDKMGVQIRFFRSKALAIKAAKAIGAEVAESVLRRRSFLFESDEASFWKHLYKKNNGVFYRGTGAGGKGMGMGALGKGIYLAWDKGMAEVFSNLKMKGGKVTYGNKGGVVEAYKVKSGLKIMDSKSNKMAEIKAMMGFQPWQYSDDPMFASILTIEAKKAGFDGVISDNPAEGLVIFDAANVEKIKVAEDIEFRHMDALAEGRKRIFSVYYPGDFAQKFTPGAEIKPPVDAWIVDTTKGDGKVEHVKIKRFRGSSDYYSRKVDYAELVDGRTVGGFYTFPIKPVLVKIQDAYGVTRQWVAGPKKEIERITVKEGGDKMESMLRKRSYLSEASGDEVEVNGKKGVWRRVANLNIFFPSDGSDPVGIPKPKDKKQAAKEVVKAKKKVKFFNRLFKHLSK